MIRLVIGAVFAATLLLSSVASAATGYVCYVRRLNVSTAGTGGSTYVWYYSEPHCGGSFLASRNYCSPNPTSPVLSTCTGQSTYLYSEGQLNSFFTAFQTASLEGTRVDYTDTGCSGGGSGCGAYFYLYGTP